MGIFSPTCLLCLNLYSYQQSGASDIKSDECKLAALRANIISHEEPGSGGKKWPHNDEARRNISYLALSSSVFHTEGSVDALTWMCDFY